MESTETKQLSNTDIARAATNNAELAKEYFYLGDRVFKIVDLDYDSYIQFLALLQPVLEVVAKQVAGVRGMAFGGGLDAAELVSSCAKSLPQMVALIARQTDPTITTEDVKKIPGQNPFKLAKIVLKQVEQNRIIGDIADFFGQILPLLTAVKRQ
jgi:hypothetical protein